MSEENIKDQLTAAMKQAMKDKEKDRLGVIRMALSALKQVEVDERTTLDDARVTVILDKMIKQRKESTEQYIKGNRPELAEKEQVEVRYYSVIYNLLDEVKQALSGMLAPETKEEIVGIAEVRDVFRSPKFGAIAGCMVVEGVVHRNKPIRVLRDDVVIFQGELESLRRFKDDAQDVRNGMECGIGVKDYNDVKPGDKIEVYEITQVERTL